MPNKTYKYKLPLWGFFKWSSYSQWMHERWFELILFSMLCYFSTSRDIQISFQLGPSHTSLGLTEKKVSGKNSLNKVAVTYQEKPFKMGEWLDNRKAEILAAQIKKESTLERPKKVPKAQHFSNLTFIMSPDYAQRKGILPTIVREKKLNCYAYIDTYAEIALKEQKEYGILASITLAQGLLESNAGDSRLARESLNHFGIKCRRKCRGCTCRNYHDDDIYDMFRVFKTPEESYREHSFLLNTSRYKKLKQYGKDYKKWAYGLKQAGYATDKKYAEKLIRIIETLKLYQYDDLT